MKKATLLIVVIFSFISCAKKGTTATNVETVKYYNAKDEMVTFEDFTPLNSSNNKHVKSWKGYQQLKVQLTALKTTTPNEILSLSDELTKTVVLMRDSIRNNDLAISGVKARVNALYNQSLRLQDMQNIPSITAAEIKNQLKGMFTIYSTLNTKIDAVYNQIAFEKELEEEVPFFEDFE
ncbi:hypothetical protein N9901_02995 [Flavobacteriaceae bacterium]|nr:hypothetical protein [Flavobacteriaceae bacterium]